MILSLYYDDIIIPHLRLHVMASLDTADRPQPLRYWLAVNGWLWHLFRVSSRIQSDQTRARLRADNLDQ